MKISSNNFNYLKNIKLGLMLMGVFYIFNLSLWVYIYRSFPASMSHFLLFNWLSWAFIAIWWVGLFIVTAGLIKKKPQLKNVAISLFIVYLLIVFILELQKTSLSFAFIRHLLIAIWDRLPMLTAAPTVSLFFQFSGWD